MKKHIIMILLITLMTALSGCTAKQEKHGTGGLASSVKDITAELPDSDIEENVLGIYREETTDAEETVQKWLREIGY